MDGKNIADYVDPEIEQKLQALEEEVRATPSVQPRAARARSAVRPGREARSRSRPGGDAGRVGLGAGVC